MKVSRDDREQCHTGTAAWCCAASADRLVFDTFKNVDLSSHERNTFLWYHFFFGLLRTAICCNLQLQTVLFSLGSGCGAAETRTFWSKTSGGWPTLHWGLKTWTLVRSCLLDYYSFCSCWFSNLGLDMLTPRRWNCTLNTVWVYMIKTQMDVKKTSDIEVLYINSSHSGDYSCVIFYSNILKCYYYRIKVYVQWMDPMQLRSVWKVHLWFIGGHMNKHNWTQYFFHLKSLF